MPDQVLAIDIGGTKLAAGLVDDNGRLRDRRSVPTPRSGVWENLAALIGPLLAGSGPDGPPVACGVGCGGPMEPGGVRVSPLNIDDWRQFPLKERLTELTGLPTLIDNDAKALALGEGWRGAASGVQNYIAIVVSTGIGGGIVLDGRLLDGAASNAGHIGHIIVQPGGAACACGARGCLEAETSGPSIAKRTRALPAQAPLAERRRAGRLVGRAVADVANLLDLRLAVLAGSVALGFGPVFFDAAQAECDDLARLPYSRGTRIVPAGLGDAGPLVGAAAVAWRAVRPSVLDP
jgi:glucokinase